MTADDRAPLPVSEGPGRWRRAVRHGWAGLRREYGRGRLRLRDLPAGAHWLSVAALVVLAGIAAVVVARAIGLGLPGPAFEVPARFLRSSAVGSLPVVALVVSGAGLAVACASLVVANQQPGRRLSRVALVGIGILGLALSSQLVGSAGDLARVEGVVSGTVDVPVPPASLIIAIGGAIGILCAVATIGLTLSNRQASLWLRTGTAAAPFAITAILIPVVGYESFDLGPAAAEAGFPPVLTASSYVAPALGVVADIVGFWLVPLALWQVVTWARASRREVAGPIAVQADVRPWLLAGILTLKLGWLALGLSGRLPVALGGGSPVWGEAMGDGTLAWIIAAAFAGLIGWWLASPRRIPVSERGFAPAALLVIVGFSSVTVIMSLALVGLPIAGLLPGTPWSGTLAAACASSWPSEAVGNAASCLIVAATDRQFELTLIVQLGTLVAAVGTSAWLWRKPGRRSMVLFLLAVVAWVSPRVPDAAGALFGLPPGPSVAPELATFDLLLTVVIAFLATAWYAGVQEGVGPAPLLLVLVVSTLLVHAGTVVPLPWVATFFFLALLFPVAYELLFDSEELNGAGSDRPARILESLGVRVGGLSLVAIGIVLGSLAPADGGWGEAGRILFAVPFAALLVAATLSRREEPADMPAPESLAEPSAVPAPAEVVPEAPAPAIPVVTPRVLGRGIGGALVVLAVALAVGTAVDAALLRTGAPGEPAASPSPSTPGPSSTGPTPQTPLERLAEFGRRASSAHGLIQERLLRLEDRLAAGATDLSAEADDLERVAANERTWLSDHPPADCYIPAGDAWAGALGRLEALATQVAAVGPGTGTEAQARIIAAADSFNVADLAFIDAFDTATVACGAAPAPTAT